MANFVAVSDACVLYLAPPRDLSDEVLDRTRRLMDELLDTFLSLQLAETVAQLRAMQELL